MNLSLELSSVILHLDNLHLHCGILLHFTHLLPPGRKDLQLLESFLGVLLEKF